MQHKTIIQSKTFLYILSNIYTLNSVALGAITAHSSNSAAENSTSVVVAMLLRFISYKLFPN